MFLTLHACLQMMSTLCPTTAVITDTEIPTIIDPSATRKYPSATGSMIVGISVSGSTLIVMGENRMLSVANSCCVFCV